MPDATFPRPFPALTPEQRLFLEINGYVVVENTLSRDEVGTLLDGIRKVRRDLEQGIPHWSPRVRFLPSHVSATSVGIAPLHEALPAGAAYCAKPRLVAMAEELIGGEARICESVAVINWRDPVTCREPATSQYKLHTGTDIGFGAHVSGGLYHCAFVKTLTNLTDLGPDDGGTVVIPGSHKIEAQGLVEAAKRDPRLIHQVIAPAGSTLLFSETLCHATGQIRSDRERVIVICGYNSRLMPSHDPAGYSDQFAALIPPTHRTLFHGVSHWTRAPKYRSLIEPVDIAAYPEHAWSFPTTAEAVLTAR
jgi:hypothetical protein